MPIKLIDPITDPRWDKFVESHSFGWVCHLSAWKRVLEESFRHMKGYYFILVDKNDDIKAGLPVYEVKSRLTGKRLVSIPFATLCDPLVYNITDFRILLDSAIEYFEGKKLSHFEIRTLHSASILSNNEKIAGINLFKHHYLPLTNDLEGITKLFHKKSVKSAISKAKRSPITITIAKDESDLRSFYDLYFITRKKLKLPPQPYHFLQNIWKYFSPSNFQILLAKHNERVIAALAFFKYKNRVSSEFSGWEVAFSEYKPNHLLYWEAIKVACSEGYSIFDFGRTSPENQGLMNFKKRWGTRLSEITHFYYPDYLLSDAFDPVQNNRRKYIQFFIGPKTPDILAKIIGNFCYRHLS